MRNAGLHCGPQRVGVHRRAVAVYVVRADDQQAIDSLQRSGKFIRLCKIPEGNTNAAVGNVRQFFRRARQGQHLLRLYLLRQQFRNAPSKLTGGAGNSDLSFKPIHLFTPFFLRLSLPMQHLLCNLGPIT